MTLTDWSPGVVEVADPSRWHDEFMQVESLVAASDGSGLGAVVRTSDGEAAVCVNGHLWKTRSEKIWSLTWLPWGKWAALLSTNGAWTVVIDDSPWASDYEFVWSLCFGIKGRSVSVAAKNEEGYFAVTDGHPWVQCFLDLSCLRVSPDGRNTAAVVQTISLGQADIETYKKGCYAVAVNGNTWEIPLVNAWDIVFSTDGSRVATSARITPYDYTIITDGRPWANTFSSIWKPAFFPKNDSVTAPVRVSGGWTLAADGHIIWGKRYFQLWHHLHSPSGDKTAAIVAVKLGSWTVAVDDKPWPCRFTDLVTDLVFSDTGERLVCIGKSRDKWFVADNGKVWPGSFDRAWPPVMARNGQYAAVLVESGGELFVLVNRVATEPRFSRAWQPVFSEDGDYLMVHGIRKEDGKYCRCIIPLAGFITAQE